MLQKTPAFKDSKSVWEQSHEGSNPSRCASSPQAAYRLRRVFSFHCNAHRALILLLLPSRSPAARPFYLRPPEYRSSAPETFEVTHLLFHVFRSQSERRDLGGSDFIEIQYCRLPTGATIHEIVSIGSIVHWKNDSLYILGDHMDVFDQNYGAIITGGIYHNEETGPMDLFGINFYSQKQAASIAERIKAERPLEYSVLLDWLQAGEPYIGFYILGI